MFKQGASPYIKCIYRKWKGAATEGGRVYWCFKPAAPHVEENSCSALPHVECNVRPRGTERGRKQQAMQQGERTRLRGGSHAAERDRETRVYACATYGTSLRWPGVAACPPPPLLGGLGAREGEQHAP